MIVFRYCAWNEQHTRPLALILLLIGHKCAYVEVLATGKCKNVCVCCLFIVYLS
jgi:hypothetical protein